MSIKRLRERARRAALAALSEATRKGLRGPAARDWIVTTAHDRAIPSKVWLEAVRCVAARLAA
jgi:hypothetical protein